MSIESDAVEPDYLLRIDAAISEAGQVMDCADIDETIPDDEVFDIWEQRHHCGTCMVRTVLETVWPSVEEYINWLRQQAFAPVEVTNE